MHLVDNAISGPKRCAMSNGVWRDGILACAMFPIHLSESTQSESSQTTPAPVTRVTSPRDHCHRFLNGRFIRLN